MKKYLFLLALGLSTGAVRAQLVTEASLPHASGQPAEVAQVLARQHGALARRSRTLHLPTRTVAYRWGNGQWRQPALNTITYTAEGWQQQLVTADSATQAPRSRSSFEYNAAGSLTRWLEESWKGTAWENETRLTITYDALGHYASYLTENWTAGSWMPVYRNEQVHDQYDNITRFVEQVYDAATNGLKTNLGYQSAYTYNATGQWVAQVTESLNLRTNSFEPQSRTTHAYLSPTSSLVTEYVYQSWQNGAWAPQSQDLLSYDARQRLSTNQGNYWINGAWEPGRRSTYTYVGVNDSFQSVEEVYSQGIWRNSGRSTNTYDAAANPVLLQQESWLNGAWSIDYAYQLLRRYNTAGAEVRTVQQVYVPDTKAFENDILVTYGNFQTFVLAARPAVAPTAAALYPNPTTGPATLELTGLRDQNPLPAEILNTLGQVVQKLTVQPRQGQVLQALDLSSLRAGLYVVQVHTADGLLVQRVVRQ